jgi:hypothetical protein
VHRRQRQREQRAAARTRTDAEHATSFFSVEFAALPLDGVQGYSRVRGANILFDSDGNTTIGVTVMEDYASVKDGTWHVLRPD